MSITNAQEILAKLRSEKATNINNILTTTNNTNNIITTNNLLTTTIIVDEINNDVEDQSLRSPLGLASLPASQNIPEDKPQSKEIHFSGHSELPAAWMNFKWDLFSNPSTKPLAQLRLNLNIVRQDGTQVKLTASLNSPHDRIWRKVMDGDRLEPHWQLIEQEYRIWRKTYGPTVADWRASKFYQAGKKNSTDLVAFFLEQQEGYSVRLFYRAMMLDYFIPKSSYQQLTDKQRAANQIATLFVGNKARRLLSADDLGI